MYKYKLSFPDGDVSVETTEPIDELTASEWTGFFTEVYTHNAEWVSKTVCPSIKETIAAVRALSTAGIATGMDYAIPNDISELFEAHLIHMVHAHHMPRPHIPDDMSLLRVQYFRVFAWLTSRVDDDKEAA